jgi:hypothetical protein
MTRLRKMMFSTVLISISATFGCGDKSPTGASGKGTPNPGGPEVGAPKEGLKDPASMMKK